ncbi:hypothetical protein CTP45_24615 [Salmonella enterica]|uniref:Uncharacterized protein n=1 Tax=Salmonella enterica subsp. enterica serovar Saintpaul TaxID=90105 RepID=A0A5U9I479_SALET|nr:hypothetical protein [Salmonella enterica]EBS2301365.1 hypothetical protein [Salmonella enterica subsp. enterica serovar Saintpaul]EDW0017499.1 hypothetical protein [Salmonella enterica subsp. enterica serovar Aba]HCZ4727709.1 hypothetical protein [Salmonella enterica subsp. enterica serovar Saintpaul str. CFSAN004137]EAW8023122.1 hypothetical protein [Salmonella enterica]
MKKDVKNSLIFLAQQFKKLSDRVAALEEKPETLICFNGDDTITEEIKNTGTMKGRPKAAPEKMINHKIFCEGAGFVLTKMKDRDNAIEIFNLLMQMSAGEIV